MFEFFSKTLSDFHAITSNLPDKTKALSMKLMFLYIACIYTCTRKQGIMITH